MATRAELHETTATHKELTFHDLRSTGVTWMAARGDGLATTIDHAGLHFGRSFASAGFSESRPFNERTLCGAGFRNPAPRDFIFPGEVRIPPEVGGTGFTRCDAIANVDLRRGRDSKPSIAEVSREKRHGDRRDPPATLVGGESNLADSRAVIDVIDRFLGWNISGADLAALRTWSPDDEIQ